MKIIHSNIPDGNMSFLWGETDEVLENRTKLLEKNNLDINNCVNLSTQRGSNILKVTINDAGKGMKDTDSAIKGDGLITNEDLALCLLTADCLPISFFDPKKGVIGLAHAGWRGTDEKITSKMAEKFINEFGSDPKDIEVEIGPGVRKESFIFENPVQKEMPEWQPYLKYLPDGQTSIDLFAYNKQQLIDVGILEENIKVSNINTGTDENYFSHYRSVRTGEKEGRFFTIVTKEQSGQGH